VLPLFEDAAKEIADEITRPRPEGEEAVKPIQIMLRSEANPIFIRQLTVWGWLEEGLSGFVVGIFYLKLKQIYSEKGFIERKFSKLKIDV